MDEFPTDSMGRLQEQRIACLRFMKLILFIFGFLLLLWLHEDIEHVYKLEHVMKIELTKEFGEHSHTIYDVNDIDEVWEFVTLAFIPTMINHQDEVGHYLPHEDWGYLAEYNRIIGGIRFSQTRSKEHECEYDLHEFYGYCQPLETHDKQSYGYPACNGTSSNDDDTHNITVCFEADHYEHAVDLYHDEGFTFDHTTHTFEMWIDLFDDEEVIWKRIEYLEDRHWIDRNTKEVTIEVVAYNGQEIPLMSKSIMSFEFTRVGYVTPHLTVETIPLSPYFHNFVLKVFLEALYVLMILNLVVTEEKELKGRYQEKLTMEVVPSWPFLRSLVDHFTKNGAAGNWLDLTNIVLGVMLCVEWVMLVFHLKHLNELLVHLHRPEGEVSYDDNDADKWSDYHHEVVEVEEVIEQAITDMSFIRTFAVVIVLSMVFELFKLWKGIPALRGIASTIAIAVSGLISFAVVIGCLLILFAGAAMLAFGQQLEEFHNMTLAIVSTLRVMTAREPELYEKQFALNPFIATVWYWMLVCIMGLVCMHLVLCILVDAYGESKASLGNMEDESITIYEQMKDTLIYFSGYYIIKIKNLKFYSKFLRSEIPNKTSPNVSLDNVTTSSTSFSSSN